jgi:hypothetical protein
VRRTHRSARGPGTPPLSATPSTSVGIMLQPDRNAALMQLGAEIPYVSVASGGAMAADERRAESRGQPADLAGSSIHGRAGLTVDGGAPGVRQLASRREGEQGWRIAP